MSFISEMATTGMGTTVVTTFVETVVGRSYPATPDYIESGVVSETFLYYYGLELVALVMMIFVLLLDLILKV